MDVQQDFNMCLHVRKREENCMSPYGILLYALATTFDQILLGAIESCDEKRLQQRSHLVQIWPAQRLSQEPLAIWALSWSSSYYRRDLTCTPLCGHQTISKLSSICRSWQMPSRATLSYSKPTFCNRTRLMKRFKAANTSFTRREHLRKEL